MIHWNLPAVYFWFVTIRQIVHTQRFITVIQKAICFSCTKHVAFQITAGTIKCFAGLSGRAVWGLRPLACWDCGFEFHRRHGCIVCCDCHVLAGRGLCDELITYPEESYRLWCVVVCDLETSWMRRPWPTGGCHAKDKQTNKQTIKCFYGRLVLLLRIVLTLREWYTLW